VPTEGTATVETHPVERYLNDSPSNLGKMSEQSVEVDCSTCGASVVFEPPEMAGACSFCGANLVTQPKSADPLIAPDGVLPFVVTKADASGRVKSWISTRWFAPNSLQRLARPEGVQGVYLPFWSFDAETDSGYRGDRGDYYYVTEAYTTTDSNGRQVQQTRQVRHTRWRAAILGALGERERAVDLLRQALREMDDRAAWHSNSALDRLRGYPPFEELILPAR